jgi:hypothetical protein
LSGWLDRFRKPAGLSCLWELEHFTSNLFEVQVKEVSLEIFFPKE